MFLKKSFVGIAIVSDNGHIFRSGAPLYKRLCPSVNFYLPIYLFLINAQLPQLLASKRFFLTYKDNILIFSDIIF